MFIGFCFESLQEKLDTTAYVFDAVKMVTETNSREEDGDILTFSTSQMEVEWACDLFKD